jgi:hypothetical protein
MVETPLPRALDADLQRLLAGMRAGQWSLYHG